MFARLHRLAVVLAVADWVGVLVALAAADLARRIVPLGAETPTLATFLNPVVYLLVAVVFPVTLASLGVYDVRRDTRPVGDPGSLTRGVAVGVFVFAGVLYFTYRDVPRLLVVYFAFLAWAGLAGIRLAVGGALRILRRRGRPLSRVLIVGNSQTAEALIEAVRARLGDSVVMVGCAMDAGTVGPGGLPVVGDLDQVPQLVTTLGVDEVILALPAAQYARVEALAFALLDKPIRVRLVPDYLRLVVVQSSVEALGGVPLIGLREPRISGLTWAVKRIFDVVVTTLILLCLWPLMVVIAVWIRLDSPGPSLFVQTRVGENGRLFRMYKFRTMRRAAEQEAPQPQPTSAGNPVYKAPADARITRIGRFLRRFSLDEMPQFFNVMRGEMSLVGPRPEQQFIVDHYEAWQRQRLAVPPGLTGWWQVNGRSDLPMHLNTQLDLYYIRNYSLWLDIKILWKTVGAVLSGRGAY